MYLHPEKEMGVRVAQALNYPIVNDYISLGNGLYVVEVSIKAHLHKTKLGHLLREIKGTVDPLLVKRAKQTFVKLEMTLSYIPTTPYCYQVAESN